MSRFSVRCLHTTRPARSYVGSAPIVLPPGVSCSIPGAMMTASTGSAAASGGPAGTSGRPGRHGPPGICTVEGPLGRLSVAVPAFVTVSRSSDASSSTAGLTASQGKSQASAEESLTLRVQSAAEKHQRSMWGTVRARLQNAVTGVTDGHTVSLRFVGVGYRAAVGASPAPATPTAGAGPGSASSAAGVPTTEVTLRLGYAKPIVLPVPRGVDARCPAPTSLILSGADRDVVTQFAAVIRSKRPPEPYKGKGVFVGDETIKIKDKKGKK